jgi:hypothetical protein
MRATYRPSLPFALAGAICLYAGWASPAAAQIGQFGGPAGPTLVAPPVAVDRGDPFLRPSREYSALPFGSWLLYPTLFAGAVFDDNIRQSEVLRSSSAGARLVPSILAERNDGIHKTSLYGMADVRLYTDHAASNADALAVRTGVIERYQPFPDLIFNLQGDYTRQRDLFSSFGIDNSVTTLNPTAIGLMPVANPLSYNQLAAAGSVQKNFDRAFVSVGGSIVGIRYDTRPDLAAPSPDGNTYTGTGRAGFWFTPFLYAYAEGAVDQRRFSDDRFNSSGYRTVGGIGSDRIGLFRGEVYGGYQSERHDSLFLGTTDGSVFGGRIYYYPLRELTLSAALDQSLGVSLLASAIPGILGASTRSTTALLKATYALAREWTASTRFGFIHTEYVAAIRKDDAWTAGATFTYSVWQNFGITLDYQYVQLDSNVPLQGFTRNVVTLGATYKY